MLLAHPLRNNNLWQAARTIPARFIEYGREKGLPAAISRKSWDTVRSAAV